MRDFRKKSTPSSCTGPPLEAGAIPEPGTTLLWRSVGIVALGCGTKHEDYLESLRHATDCSFEGGTWQVPYIFSQLFRRSFLRSQIVS